MNGSTLQIRIDSQTKNNVKKILKSLGLDFSTAIKIYFKQIEKRKGLPFSVVTENGLTPKQEEQILEESQKLARLRKKGKLKTYASAEELFADLFD